MPFLFRTIRKSKWYNHEGTPWLVVTVEDIALNVPVSEYIRAKGL